MTVTTKYPTTGAMSWILVEIVMTKMMEWTN
jgi:hypothetical protein